MALAPPALLRPAAALAAAALALHELRYRLAGAGHDEVAVPAPGHGYLPVAQAAAVLLLVLAGAAGLRAVARGGDPAGRPRRLGTDWARISLVLLLVHLGQEAAEGLLAGGASPGAPLGPGAWVAAPLALALGAVVALLLRGADSADRAVRAAGVSATPLRPPRAAVPPAAPLAERHRPLTAALATGSAGRAPPLAVA